IYYEQILQCSFVVLFVEAMPLLQARRGRWGHAMAEASAESTCKPWRRGILAGAAAGRGACLTGGAGEA
uniref:Uncharacterized protein n=1 Tax=Aegilops tauschii subsp. strangulata TaxID=200361 RepID=A0A453KH72_AEGTS